MRRSYPHIGKEVDWLDEDARTAIEPANVDTSVSDENHRLDAAIAAIQYGAARGPRRGARNLGAAPAGYPEGPRDASPRFASTH
jgi:hypothetical protein